VGLFDISHMGRLQFDGPGTLEWLERSTTNHVAKLAAGQIQYSLMANARGGVHDDLLVYRSPAGYQVVCNASNREKVVEQFHARKAAASAALTDSTLESAMLAVQGPKAIETLQPLCDVLLQPMRYYYCGAGTVNGVPGLISRTGYTGEDGFEIVVDGQEALGIWEALLASGGRFGILPCGLGARDTLRLEAAMCLYGHELSEEINPYAAGVGWAVKLNKGDFVGRKALRSLKTNPGSARIGLVLDGKRIARQGATVFHKGQPSGTVTSGTFSPTLGQSIAIALVEPSLAIASEFSVDVRGHLVSARVAELPFYQRPAA
jgi:glycine cleavage system T protein (aminomethyltransferase)